MPIWCTESEGEHVFQRKNRFWMHCSELFAKQGWSIVFDLVIWSLFVFRIFFIWHTQSEDVTWHQLSPLTANQCILVFVCFSLVVFPNIWVFITVVVRFKIGANMNLAAANPGQRVGDDPAEWVVNFGFCFVQCCQFRLFYCFCIPSSPSFCFVDFEQIFGFKFSKTKTFRSRILSVFLFCVAWEFTD